MKREKLMIVDLDGTLFDTSEANYLSYRQVLEEYGFSLDKEYYVNYCNGRLYREYLPGLIQGKKELVEKIHERKKEIYPDYFYAVTANQHLLAILESARKDYYLSIVTTASRKNARDILNFFGVLDQFDLLITHEDVNCVKPDPEGFQKAMKYFEIPQEATVIFEDSKEGIEAALKSGGTVFRIEKF